MALILNLSSKSVEAVILRGDGDADGDAAATHTVRGEKATQVFSQGLVDYEDKQTDIANTRIPYASTL